MTSSAPAARNAYIDTLRGWSIFGVVCVHFAGSFVTTDVHAWSPSFFLGLGLNQFFSFAVPLFVFLSGYLAGVSRRRPALGEYYLGRLTRIGLPYLLASLASFFLLNHQEAWRALPGLGAKFTWLWQRLLFFGVEPTLYFIPLILQLYLLQPALQALPGWLHRLLPAVPPARHALALALALLALHLALGLLCNSGRLNYYVWGRPNSLFWMFYFFCGLHFSVLTEVVPRRAVAVGTVTLLATAAGAMGWNFLRLLDPAVVGLSFELNRLDFAYARPEMLVYDLAVVAALAAGIVAGRSPRPGAFSFLGRYTLEIYLWHILVLYFGAWRYPGILAACRELPEVILLICAAATAVIAGLAAGFARARDFIRHHRVTVVETGG